MEEIQPETHEEIEALRARTEQIARAKISAWWARIDEQESLPTDTNTVIRLLQAVEYEVDSAKLSKYIDDGLIDAPEMVSGRRRWTAVDIVKLAFLLESRREWRAFSPLHDCKKSWAERHAEQAAAVGDAVFNDLQAFDVRGLLLMLVESENRQIREALRVALISKLSERGVEA